MSAFGNKLSSFIDHHPGGCYNLALAAFASDDEAKMLFLSYHTGKDISKIKQTAKLLNFTDIPTDSSQLQQEIQMIFSTVEKKYSIHGIIYKIYCTIIFTAFLFSIVNNIFNASLWNTFVLGCSWLSYSFVIFHTRHHLGGKIFFLPIKNKTFQTLLIDLLDILDNLLMVPPKQWLYNHELSHHLYTNSPIDYDVVNVFPFLRLTDIYKQQFFHKFQWFYGLILLALNGFAFPLKNVKENEDFRPSKANNIDAPDGKWPYFIIYLLLFIILPFHFNGVYALKLFFGALLTASLWTSMLFQVSHHVLDVKHDNKEYETVIKDYDQWIKTQVEESMSWGGYMATLVFGGINFQIEHHIAPAVLPIYYYFVNTEIRKLCEKYHIKYVYFDNVWIAIWEYERYVFLINQN